MNCDQSLRLLNTWCDGELNAADETAIEAHLRECASCRVVAENIQRQHADLRRAFQASRNEAAMVADRVVAVLPDVVDKRKVSASFRVPEPKSTRRTNWMSLMLAMALGFLIALLIFPPWKVQRPAIDENLGQPQAVNLPRDPISPSNEAGPTENSIVPVARLIVAAGDGVLEYSDETREKWQPIPDLPAFSCPSNGAVRTTNARRCELLTTAGCVVRMNGDSEVVFRSPRQVELKRGEIWCRGSDSAALEVVPSIAGEQTQRPDGGAISPFSCTAENAASFLTAVQPGDRVQVTAAAGKVSVKAHDTLLQLQPSESATITRDRVDRNHSLDRLLAASWMQPLLTSKGHADPELAERVDELLALVGESKLSTLYESEIRNLGEYCVLPLLRYVESPRSASQGERRLLAMRIISDLAPAWAIGDLIRLLQDEQAEVRFLSATTLERLTAQNQGVTAEQWRSGPGELEPAFAAWRTWWNANRERFPMQLEGFPSDPPEVSPPPFSPGMKVRRPKEAKPRTG